MPGAQLMIASRAREQDGEDFRQMVEGSSHAVFRLAYRMTGNAEDAEDVVQETFLRAYRHRARFETRAHVSSWLHRIATNYAIDLLRRRRRRPATDSADPEPLPSPTPGPERLAMGREWGRHIERALDRLTPRERAAFVLRHHEGCSIEEIGGVLGTRTNATKNHVFRAVRKLRAALSAIEEPS